MYMMLGVDDNVLMTLHSDDFGVAVGVTAVVDEARKPTLRPYQKFNSKSMTCSCMLCNWPVVGVLIPNNGIVQCVTDDDNNNIGVPADTRYLLVMRILIPLVVI